MTNLNLLSSDLKLMPASMRRLTTLFDFFQEWVESLSTPK